MINLTFPDGSIKSFDQNITGQQLATSISTSLAKKAFLLEIDSQIVDLNRLITRDAKVRIITEQDQESVEIIRHDCAHLLAQAVQKLFPQAKPTIGPVVEHGFYYDFADISFALEDLQRIEDEMHVLSKANLEIKRLVYSRQEAINLFKNLKQEYKVELIESIPAGEEVSLYQQGDFIDLCRGPHGPSTARLKHFKLTKLAGAYWRGDSSKPMLQRIYGVAFASKEDLDNYFVMLEEAAARDHRKIGKDMQLFHLQEEAPGMVFWHPKGRELYLIIEQYIRQKLKNAGYVEVKTPVLLSKSLWEKSGHWDKFRENMFVVEDDGFTSSLKPMSCPCHIQIFKQNIKSYRDLPMRMAEFGFCHRNEPSGSLHGLMRVRGFVQDDAHIFCTPEQVIDETIAFCDLLKEMYTDFGFHDVQVKFSDRPEARAGSDEVWDKAEKALKDAVQAVGLEYSDNKGEGAFYGPKLEFVLKDAIGRDWQCGTLQVDFVLPERLDASYTASNGKKERPVMLHRAIIGTFERFIGILIEQYKGRLPLWLAPVQIVVATITQAYEEYARQIFELLRAAGIRCELDIENEKIGYKIRKHACAKVPFIAIIGKKETQECGVTISSTSTAQTEDEWVMKDDLVSWIQNIVKQNN